MNRTDQIPAAVDVAIVGGGLAGLAAAALAARAGRSVVVLEQSHHLGGRAATNLAADVHFNLGPRALYSQGHARRLLNELGIPFSGKFPSPGRARALFGGALHQFPLGLGSLATSRLLSWGEKLRFATLLTTLRRADARKWEHVSLAEWVAQTAGRGNLALLLAALARLSTYVDDATELSAGVAIEQLQSALTGNVLYIDGGWQTLVDGLRTNAAAQGATILTSARASAVSCNTKGVLVSAAGDETITAQAVILAVDPATACQLLALPADAPLARFARDRIPVPAACLDVALARLPRPHDRFALGIDRPYYFSVHSAAARLGPAGVAVLHVMKYLREDADESAAAVEAELSAFLEQVQPGWQAHVVARRFLSRMVVTQALPRASAGGLFGRPGTKVDERPGVYLAGDWVGANGMLADAATSSAEEAVGCVLAAMARVPAQNDARGLASSTGNGRRNAVSP